MFLFLYHYKSTYIVDKLWQERICTAQRNSKYGKCIYNFICIGYLICLTVSFFPLKNNHKTPFNILNTLLKYLVRNLGHLFLRNIFSNSYFSRKNDIPYGSKKAFIDLEPLIMCLRAETPNGKGYF